MADGEPVPGSLYIYAPNKVAPVIFAVLFAFSAAGHVWQCYRYKAFRMVGLHPACAVVLAIGYALREYGAFNYIYTPSSLSVFICSQLLIYLCPPALELVNYHVLSRIFRYIPHLAPLKPVLVMPVFGVVMSVVETLNSVGVSLFTNPVAASSRQTVGKNLVLAAVILQMVIILVFFAMVGVFHSRCVKAGVLTTQHDKKEINLGAPLWTLYGSMALILVRCIYRLVEKLAWNYALFPDFAQLRKLSPLIRYEWFFYVFEATLILLNSGIWNVWHPGRFLPASHRAVLHEDGTAAGNSGKEVMGVNAAGV